MPPTSSPRESNNSKQNVTAITSEVKQQGKEIEKHIEGIIRQIFETSKQQDKTQQTTKSLILEWVAALDEKFRIYQNENMVYLICNTIIRNLKIRSAPRWLINYAYEVIPPKYKASSDKSPVRFAEHSAESIEEDSTYRDIVIDLLIKLQETNLYALSVKDNQLYFETLERLTKHSKEFCDNHKIAILPEDGQHGFDSIPDRYSETIRIQKPEPLETGLSALIQRYIDEIKLDLEEGNKHLKTVEGWKLKTIAYPPVKIDEQGNRVEDTDFVESCSKGFEQMIQMARDLRDGIRIASLFFAPTLDDKWRRTWVGWSEIVKKRYEHGKHGASSLTGDVDADGNRRRITREQIGDKTPLAIKFFQDAVMAIGIIRDNHRWYKNFKQMYTSKLSNDLHAKLSERS